VRPGRTRALHVVGGLFAIFVVVALPMFLGLAAPDRLADSGCAGDPAAAALRSLDQALQGNRSSDAPSPAALPFEGTALLFPPVPVVAVAAMPVAIGVRLSPVENGTSLTL
jgi:hypothetical protein